MLLLSSDGLIPARLNLKREGQLALSAKVLNCCLQDMAKIVSNETSHVT